MMEETKKTVMLIQNWIPKVSRILLYINILFLEYSRIFEVCNFVVHNVRKKILNLCQSKTKMYLVYYHKITFAKYPLISRVLRVLRSSVILHYVKYRNFTQFVGVENLWKGIVSTQFQAIRPKLCGSCAFPHIFHTKKLGEITVFYPVCITVFHLRKRRS